MESKFRHACHPQTRRRPLEELNHLHQGVRVRSSLPIVLEALQFPILEYLECFLTPCNPVEDSLAAANLDLHAPRLRHCALINYGLPTDTLSSLVTLEIDFFPLIRRFDAVALLELPLNVAETLKCLRLKPSEKVLQAYTSDAPNIQLPVLEVLDLRYMSELLLFISTPNLRTLNLGGYAEGAISPFTSFDAPELAHLKLIDLPVLDLGTIPDLPWRFKKLETVLLYLCRSSRSFFCHASSTRDGTPAFPSLRFIAFDDPEVFVPIKSMVKWRKDAGPNHPTLK